MTITIENVEHITLHLGNPGDPTVARLLDSLVNATTPIRFTSNDAKRAAITPPAIGELWVGQGGYYVGILPAIGDRAAQYMIAGEQEARLKWGPYIDVEGARSRHDGRVNTAALVGDEFPAAQWCRNYVAPHGQRDFHLPSQAELFIASLYAPQVFGKESWYWTSTQVSRDFAFVQGFEDGYSSWYSKDFDFRVRAVRWIPLTT